LIIPFAAHARMDYESILKADIDAPILDVATNPAEDLIFLLTPEAVMIYSTKDRTVIDRIPIEQSFERIAFLEGDRLVLTNGKPSRIDIIRFSRIYSIDLTNRAIMGPADAKVTLVVFDDYQ
jgi:hypothetical protein